MRPRRRQRNRSARKAGAVGALGGDLLWLQISSPERHDDCDCREYQMFGNKILLMLMLMMKKEKK
jgi:hypothetical protein